MTGPAIDDVSTKDRKGLIETAQSAMNDVSSLDRDLGATRIEVERLRHSVKLYEATVLTSGEIAGRTVAEKDAHLLLFLDEDVDYRDIWDQLITQRKMVVELEASRDHKHRLYQLARTLLGGSNDR